MMKDNLGPCWVIWNPSNKPPKSGMIPPNIVSPCGRQILLGRLARGTPRTLNHISTSHSSSCSHPPFIFKILALNSANLNHTDKLGQPPPRLAICSHNAPPRGPPPRSTRPNMAECRRHRPYHSSSPPRSQLEADPPYTHLETSASFRR